MMERIRKSKARVFHIVQIGEKGDTISRLFDIFIVIVICANVLALVLETFSELRPWFPTIRAVETVTVLIFCLEYAVRIWTAPLLYPDKTPAKAVARFLYSYDGIVDLLTILPFFFLSGFAAFRILKVARILHLFRINANYDSFNVITSVLYEKRNQLMSSLFIIFILMLASSLCIYSAEHKAQPHLYRNAFSGIWWCISAIFTVGYGDIYPITFVGRVMAVIITILGVGAVAIPTGIISAGFVEQYSAAQAAAAGRHPDNVTTATVLVNETSENRNKTVREIEEGGNVTVSAILRAGAILVPSDHLRVLEGDTLVLIYRN